MRIPHPAIKLVFYLVILLLISLPGISLGQTPAEKAFELFKEGVSHLNRLEYEAAIDRFRRALRIEPDNERFRYFLAMGYYRAGYEEQALYELGTIINKNPEDGISRNIYEYLNKKRFKLINIGKSTNYTPGLTLTKGSFANYSVVNITGIDVDTEGNLYIACFGSKVALKISPQGKVILGFTSPKINNGRLYDIKLGPDGTVYISDFSRDTIYVYSNRGKLLNIIGSSGTGEGELYGPTSLAVDSDGDVYVIDSGNIRINKYSPMGKFLMSFGKEGVGEGEFLRPSGIAVDHSGLIYISDHVKKKIGVYDRNGNFISYLEGIELHDPYGLSITDTNILLVSDRDRVLGYNISSSDWTVLIEGDYEKIMSAEMDMLGQLYISDYRQSTVSQFVPEEDKYRNLTVILDRIDTNSYPAISYYITVMDADGLPLYGLSRENFLLKIGKAPVQKIDLSYNRVRDSQLRVMFLADKSNQMSIYKENIREYLPQFLSKLSTQDEAAVVSFNSKSWISSVFTRSRLEILNAITEETYEEGKKLDIAFRRAIDILNKEFYKKALILITDGVLTGDSFSTYSLENCTNYATNNHIPVYVLSFTNLRDKKLVFLAKSTGGKYINVMSSGEYPFLYDMIRSYRSAQYLVFFNDVYDPELSNKYLDAEVEVIFNARFGKGKLGMIYP